MQAIVNKVDSTVTKFLDDGENLTDDQAAHYFLVPNVEPVALPSSISDSAENAVCKWENSQLEWSPL
jgi:hypothetical protein